MTGSLFPIVAWSRIENAEADARLTSAMDSPARNEKPPMTALDPPRRGVFK